MSTGLKEFLRQQAALHQAEVEAAKTTVAEWHAAVDRLFAQLRKWLGQVDPGNIIEIRETLKEVNEPGLGRYDIPRLDIRIFDKWLAVLPKARGTIGRAKPPQKSAPERAIGRVDITDELRRFILYRFQGDDGTDLWMMDDLQSEPKPLDQDAFEEALLSYLR